MARDEYCIQIGKRLVREFGLRPSEAKELLDLECAAGGRGILLSAFRTIANIPTVLESVIETFEAKNLMGKDAYVFARGEIIDYSVNNGPIGSSEIPGFPF